jgi:hypothetical protein
VYALILELELSHLVAPGTFFSRRMETFVEHCQVLKASPAQKINRGLLSSETPKQMQVSICGGLEPCLLNSLEPA